MDIVSYILAKKYVNDSLAGAGALAGKSAYEIAKDNGFSGSEKDWLESLHGKTPEIGPEGTWVIDGFDTGVIASPSLAGYATEEYVNALLKEIDLSAYATKEDLTVYATKKYVDDLIDALEMPEGGSGMIAMTEEEILEICKIQKNEGENMNNG